MFRATFSPIFRSTLTVYTAFWNNVPTLMPAADRCHRSAAEGHTNVKCEKCLENSSVIRREI